jgi:hypothetical protein
VKTEGKEVKKCPLLKEWCTDEVKKACPWNAKLTRRTPAGMQTILVCGIEAMIMMLSEINQKTSAPPQPEVPQIVLPFMGRG